MVVYLYSCHICLLGKGSVLTNKGGIEMDAIIMEGSTLKTGNINKKIIVCQVIKYMLHVVLV